MGTEPSFLLFTKMCVLMTFIWMTVLVLWVF